MDLQAQDRAHRIGQTREVHIYRLISENTVEENIYKKAQQKTRLNAAVIGDGGFTVDFFQALDPRELLGIKIEDVSEPNLPSPQSSLEMARAMAEVEDFEDRVASAHAADEQNRSKATELSEFADGSTANGSTANDLSAVEYSERMEESLTPIQRFAVNYDKHYRAFESMRSKPMGRLSKLKASLIVPGPRIGTRSANSFDLLTSDPPYLMEVSSTRISSP
jgi:hypothetical protein